MTATVRDWSHDIDLPQYGPYNKQYVGFSHIASPERGLRLDIDLLPGFYRRSVMDTRSVADGGARLWRARPDLKRFVYRYELLPPQKIYLEADFAQEGDAAALRCTFVNETNMPQSLQADFCFSLRVPSFWRVPYPGAEVALPAGVIWIPAGDYAAQQGIEGIAHDGFFLGEEPEPHAARSCAMRVKEGVRLSYRFDRIAANSLLLRCRAEEGAAVELMGKTHPLPKSEALIPVCLSLPEGEYSALELNFTGAAVVDGFAIGLDAGRAAFEPWPDAFAPEIEERPGEMTLRYPLADAAYAVRWDAPDYVLRELLGDSDGDILARNIHEHVSRRLKGAGAGHFTDLFVRPVFLAPHEQKTVTLLISAGGVPREVPFPPLPERDSNPCGRRFDFSMERLAATTAMGIVYPAYYRGGFIRSYSPGRVWDSFYTWDCGMVAVGLTAIDRARALDCLRAYLMPQEDPRSPYLNHGTPLLTQMFAFKNLLDAGEKAACRALYPALRFAYRFFLTLPRHGGLIATWQIFYNSGGWDDYPAQVYTHAHHLEQTTAPVIVTSMMLIYGGILKNAARQLGFDEDISAYDRAGEELAAAIARCWDEETGYFGYAMDDGILRDERGVNLNQGLDGLYPLLAGLGTKPQKRRMLKNIREGLFTPIGVSVVDTRAPYYSHAGYWNGSVWMPHQWILWKALLDLGEAALAHRVARTALRLWQRETGVSGNCYEHFMIATGRGAGYHHFSGLSSPVLDWFRAYYQPGSATVGFDTAILSQRWNDDKTVLDIGVETHTSGAAVLITMREGPDYRFEGLPEGAKVKRVHPGTYCLQWPHTGPVSISVKPRTTTL
ncbi:MAG: hypothetical protein IJ048_07865 [Clostridia bacterium]|nr:hypothetical protein [Clostridia bacterium]